MSEPRSFGHNGVVLDAMGDKQLARELPDRRRFHVWYPVVLYSLLALAFVANRYLNFIPADSGLEIAVFWTVAASILGPALVAQAQYAIEDFRLPQAFGLKPRHRHVSGAAVLLVAALLTFVVSMLRVVDGLEGDLVMGGGIGILVVCLITLAFVLFILSPRLIRSRLVLSSGRAIAGLTSRSSPFGRPLNLLGRAVSVFDSWMVYIIAPAAGMSQKRWTDRYGVLSLYLIMSGLLVWFCPAPFGLLPAAVWFLLAVSVARRWAWIEDDREITLRKPKFAESELRVGVGEDLRDEALLALLSLIALLPLAMRQIHFGFGEAIFATSDGAFHDNIGTWMAFFGLELAKAIPFVDWADIYDVKTEYLIAADSMAAHHVVFVARAIVDLVFLSALLQAISISLKLSRHKRMFFNREINLLDPMIERLEFEKLVYKDEGVWKVRDEREVEKFAHYDPIGLARIRTRHRPDSAMYVVATTIKDMQVESVSPASERFLEMACRKEPDLDEVTSAWKATLQIGETPLEFLVVARSSLNGKSDFNRLREQIVRELVSKPVSVARNSALRNILTGDEQDSIRDIRRMTIDPLKASAQWDHWNMRALKAAAQKDRSQLVRRAAAKALRELGPMPPPYPWPPSNPPEGGSAPAVSSTIPVLGTIE